MIVLDLCFVDFSERCTKRQLFVGVSKSVTGKLLALKTSQFPAAVSGGIASSCLADRRSGDKDTSECWDFLKFAYFEGNVYIYMLTLKEMFIFISLYRYDGIRDVIE